nr:cucumber peeling cupredoxin-like [Tanacetum cinerariifolium]
MDMHVYRRSTRKQSPYPWVFPKVAVKCWEARIRRSFRLKRGACLRALNAIRILMLAFHVTRKDLELMLKNSTLLEIRGDYTTWAASQTFRVGDTLFFNFTTGMHNVQEVSQSAYGPCTVANPISTETNGPATITLRTAGNHYYICAFGTHCQAGQKVTVNVVGGSTPTPPASTSPAPAGSPPSTPDATTSPPPPSPSSASTLTAVVPAAFLAAALALVY